MLRDLAFISHSPGSCHFVALKTRQFFYFIISSAFGNLEISSSPGSNEL